MAASYNSLYSTYKNFVKNEQKFNTKIKNDNIDWYKNIVDASEHFLRNDLDVAASSESLSVKRIVLLNAFEHIASAERAYALRKLDYQDYFTRRDESLSYDNEIMDNTLAFVQGVILTEIE